MPKRHAILPVKDVNQQVFVRRLGHYLKKSKKVELPEWVDFVKTGYSKELPPNTQDWLYIRMASIIRRVYMRCPSGVGALARRYGSRNRRRGVRPAKTAQGSRKLIRYSLQQFEKLGWIRKAERGRKLTRAGKLFMDEFSGRVKRSPMVTAYWRRRQKQERLARKLQKRKEDVAGDTAGGDDAEQVTAGADVDYQAPDDQYITGQEQNVDVVQQFD
mmetsp:Transcript_17508/g.27435  ORF Transcript_17508/g.27435 Transcript_17508/m.27435 type:complete len:216 (-) Transcript_17508:172-819(-)|eukprot:CAMPEP_0202686714 /NCGR_PEP_ID=MMETSP1385-20130828/2475_1 /ASSEMBLY_ACC=CAM_ASM_000861 /TAXON_ID=933848 /ORGANISM="Elphidium margaritaceum" /LENGTH=215 /DNA_ID=CAMNT_0049341351 /DNA_START=107 /DNA_END=754 /DNA_ORIENTATION=+